jgi:hypothetical protein
MSQPRLKLSLGWASMARLWATFGPMVGYCFSFFLESYPRNTSKLPKCVEICRNLQKMQNKFCWNPCWEIYPEHLTTLPFSHNVTQYKCPRNQSLFKLFKHICTCKNLKLCMLNLLQSSGLHKITQNFFCTESQL